MWSTLLLPLLLLHLVQLHSTLAMATASGGLTVLEGSSTSSSSGTGSGSVSSSSSIITGNMFVSVSPASSSASASASASASSTSPTAASPVATGLRKRHRKRNSSWYDYRNYSENNTALEWINPCGGSYYTPSAPERRRVQRPKQIFNQLKRAAGTEYRMLNNSQEHKGIDIRDMQKWSLYNPSYKFLPKLKPNSTIALKRWYRNMQTYVASFAYLRRVQVNWDRHHQKRESPAAKELKNLLLSSRSMLCELETAVNRTYPALAPGRAATPKQRRLQQLPQISRNDMNKRLKLRSKRRPAPASASASASSTAETDAIDMRFVICDMRFVKHHYYEFLRTMWQLLRRDGKRERQQRRQRRQRRQQRQRESLYGQWQQQQQQQQQLQLSEFNEVSKPSSNIDASGRRGKRHQQQQPLSQSQSPSQSTSTSASSSATAAVTQRHQRRVLRT